MTIDPTVPVRAVSPLPVTLPYSAANPLPAHLAYQPGAPMPVEITSVKKTGDWEPVRVEVEPSPGRARPGGGDR